MSSNADFVSAQRRLVNLFENGHNMGHREMVMALDGLLGVTQQMVRNRREEIRNQRAVTPPPREQEQVPPAIVRRDWPNLAADYLRAGDYEQAREAIGRAERAEALTAARFTGPVRPSALLRQINELRFAERAPLGQRRDWMSWQFYEPVYIKKRSIGQARFEANCDEACVICLDTHTNGDSVVTECNHCFGKECWKTWMCNPTGNQSCPTCRTDRPNVIAYTMRRPRANAMVEEDISVATQEN
jgi:hypothetical protein